jgi:hypothetical protein
MVGAMRSAFAALVLAGVLSLVGCGDSDDSESPDHSGSPREQVVAVVAAMQSALANGDGEQACAYMTPRGQRLMVRLTEAGEAGTAEGCEEAVELVAELVTEEQRRLNEKDVVTPDEVAFFRDGTVAEAYSDYRGAMRLRLVDQDWRVDIPAFVD